MSFDLTPYSIVNIKFTNEADTVQRIIGRTGILTLEPTYPIDSCIIKGKRMIEVPTKRSPYLDD